jgi:L-malate glycosyltransferase
MSDQPLQGIAICTVGELFGGVERHVLGMLQGLAARDIASMLILFHDGELAEQARAQGIEPVVLSSSNRSLLTTSRRLAGILEQRQMALVHAHGYKAMVHCAVARHWYSFALLKTEHGLPEIIAGKPLQTVRNRAYHLLDVAASRMANATVCYVTEELRAHYLGTKTKPGARVIHNGIAPIDPAQLKRPPEFVAGKFNLVIVGRLDEVKGHQFAIEAVAAQKAPNDVHLHIVGVGPSEATLRMLTKTLGVSSRIHFLGFRRNIYDYLAHGDALLMPSLHEGLPYTLLEAMALGKAIIASRVGGLAETLEDGVTALLIPPADSVALAQAIVRLHREPDLALRLGERARQLQESQYSLDTMTDLYVAQYRELLHKSVTATS